MKHSPADLMFLIHYVGHIDDHESLRRTDIEDKDGETGTGKNCANKWVSIGFLHPVTKKHPNQIGKLTTKYSITEMGQAFVRTLCNVSIYSVYSEGTTFTGGTYSIE